MLLPAVGLVLDVVGAVALVVGLFRPPRPLTPGYAYAPDEVARDVAFGTVGATLLVAGFGLQSLQYVGVHVRCSTLTVAVAMVGVLALALAFAWIAYGAIFLVALAHARRYGKKTFDMDYPLRRERRGLRFWRQVPDHSPPPEP
jgi:hypothetical protein